MAENPKGTTTIGVEKPEADVVVETTLDNARTTTFDSPKTAAEHCGLILGDIKSVGERARAAMNTGYAEAQAQKIDLAVYTTKMQRIYDEAKNNIDAIIAQLAAIQGAITSPENTLPDSDKASIVRVIERGVEQARRSKAEIVDQLEQQRVRRPLAEEVLHNLDQAREAYGIAAAAGTLDVGETNPRDIAQSAQFATRSVRENTRPVPLAEGIDNRAVQYEDAELRARALGLTQLLDERLAKVDETLAAQAGMHGLGLETMAQMRKAYASLEAYKLTSNDWRDPAKSGLAARFLGNADGRMAVKVLLAAGSFAAFASGFAALGTGIALTRTVAGGVMGYFAGEKVGRARAEKQAIAAGSAEVRVPDKLDSKSVSDDQLMDLIARMEYKALIAGKSLTQANDADPTAMTVDPDYKRLIEELQKRSVMDKEGARSYSTSLETKLRQADARLRELLKDREAVERAALIGGVVGGSIAAFLPSVLRGGYEGLMDAMGYDGYSMLHGAAAPIIGNANAEYISGTGAYSPDALAAAAAANAPTPSVAPASVLSGPPPAPVYANTMGQGSMPNPSPGWRNPLIAGNSPELNTDVTAQAVVAAEVPTPDAGSFVPDKTEFAQYIVGKGEGVSWPLKAQLIEHADKYGWDGTGDKTKWATKKMFELMKSEEFTIDGKSMAIYNADIDKQLWVDEPDRYSFILKYDGKGGYSMDVYDMKAPGGPALLSGNYDQALSEHTISESQGAGGGSAAQGAGQGRPGQYAPGTPTAPEPAPIAPEPGATIDENGKVVSGPGKSADLAPNANNKVQWYDQAGFKSEGKYKDAIFGQIYGKAGVAETWSFGASDPSSDISQNLVVNNTLPLDKAGSTGLKFSDNFTSIKDFTGSVPTATKEALFNDSHPPFTGKFGKLADEYAQLRQAQHVLDHSTSLNTAVISPSEIAAMKKAIARELAERVRKLLEFEGALNEDIRPARVFGKN